MKKTSLSEQGARLIRLRQNLGLSQREMAREFDVSNGAINHWEKGVRVIPGPVMKLIELYESYLEEENSEFNGSFLRGLSSSWASRWTASIRSACRISPSEIKRGLEGGLQAFLENNLSKDFLKQKIQIALLKRGIDSISQMKGLPLKAAQILTCLSPELAPELRKTLADLEYIGRAMAPTLAAKAIYQEFGARPDQLFAEWSAKPFAVASIGQVHRARLRTGEEVAVKIQYPNIKKSLENDFRDLSFLQQIASLVKPVDRDILSHIREAVLSECDYKNELANIERFRNLFENHPEILIPRPYPEYSSQRVLTMEYIEGRTFSEFLNQSTQAQRDRAGETIWKFTMESQLKHGLINADAHAGNFLFLGERVAFVDFGRVYQIDPETLRTYRQFCVHFSLGEREKARVAFGQLPMVLNADMFDDFWNAMLTQQRHGIAGQSFRFSHPYIAEGMRATRSLSKDGLKLTKEILWCNCSSFGLWSIFADLGASARWGDMAVEILSA